MDACTQSREMSIHVISSLAYYIHYQNVGVFFVVYMNYRKMHAV